MKFIHTILLTVLSVAFLVSVTATPVLVHACKGMLERACDNDCCGNQAEESCCNEIVSVTSLDCDMVKAAYAPVPEPGNTFSSSIEAPYVKSLLPRERADEWTLRTGPDPTRSGLCIFLI